MPNKLIKKYRIGAAVENPSSSNYADLNQIVSLGSQQQVTSTIAIPQGPVPAPILNPANPSAEVKQMVLNKLDSISSDKDWEEFMRKKSNIPSQSFSSMAKNIGIGVGTSYLGNFLGNAVGGEAGNAIGTVAGNLGQNILTSGSLAGGLKNFSKFSNWGNLAGGIATGILDRSTKHQRYSGKYGTLASGIDTISPLINTAFRTNNPYGMVGSVGMAAINKITGGTDGMTIADSLLGSSALSGALFAANPLVGAGYMALSGINSATGRTTSKNLGRDFQTKQDLADLWGSYSKSERDHRDAMQYGGKKYGGISVLTGNYGRAQRKVLADNERINNLMNIHDRRELGQIRGDTMADINSLDYRLNTFGGYDQYGTRVGRKGMKLPNKQEISRIREILKKKNSVEQFKNGGQMSVIPEGALHARLHHLEGIDNITKKGIPVVDKSGEQQAEIERNEIIFSLEVTNKLEQLRKDGSDKAAIKAGKLLVEEIFHNTDDRTGLIQEVIGTDEAKKGLFKEGGIIKSEEPLLAIIAEEPVMLKEGGILAEEPEIDYLQNGGFVANPKINNFIEESVRRSSESAIPSLEDWLNTERGKIMEQATESARTRKLPYIMPRKDWMNCIATALDNYKHAKIPMTYSNMEFYANPNKYGFEALNKSGEDIDFSKLPFGVIVQDANDEEANLGNSDAFHHSVMLVGYDDDKPRFAWSKGHSNAESVVNYGNYPFIWSNRKDGTRRGPIAYRFIGTPEWIESKTKEYYKLYPKKHKNGGIIAEEPSIEKEIEEFESGNKIRQHFVYKPKLKPKYEDWIKDVNPEYLSDNYDIKMAYEVLPFEQLERWKFGVNSNDPKYYMDYQDDNGIYTYHLPSIAELDNGDFIFLKKGTEKVNPELHFETDMYHNGENGFKNTHDLKFEGDRYYYRKKKSFKDGGIIEQLNKLSPDKLQELENILKYLNQ